MTLYNSVCLNVLERRDVWGVDFFFFLVVELTRIYWLKSIGKYLVFPDQDSDELGGYVRRHLWWWLTRSGRRVFVLCNWRRNTSLYGFFFFYTSSTGVSKEGIPPPSRPTPRPLFRRRRPTPLVSVGFWTHIIQPSERKYLRFLTLTELNRVMVTGNVK